MTSPALRMRKRSRAYTAASGCPTPCAISSASRGRSGGAPVGEEVLSEGLTENQLRGLRRSLPMIAEEVELVTELRQRVDGGDDAPEHPVQLPELEQGHARVGSPPVRVLVISDE